METVQPTQCSVQQALLLERDFTEASEAPRPLAVPLCIYDLEEPLLYDSFSTGASVFQWHFRWGQRENGEFPSHFLLENRDILPGLR